MAPVRGIIFPGNMGEPGDSRCYMFGWKDSGTGAPPPAQYPCTILMETFPMTGNRTYWTYFHNCHFETSFSVNGTVDYYGCHPYPTGGAVNGVPLWEITARHVDTTDDVVVFGKWYKHATVATDDGTNRNHKFWYDWDNRAGTAAPFESNGPIEGDPTDHAICIGDAPWSQGHEGGRMILGSIRIFAAALTETQIDNEFTTPGSSGVSYHYYNPGLLPSDITDKSGNGNDAYNLATTPQTAIAWQDGVLGLDAMVKEVRTGTSDPHTWTHTPAGTPKGILVFAIHGTSSTDHITSMTYGGVSMSRVITATDTATELGRTDAWFLGSGVPTGNQTVSADLASATTDDILFASISLTGARDLEVIDSDSISENAANPSRTMNYGGRTGFSLGAAYLGGSDSLSLEVNADTTKIMDHDFGAFAASVFCQTTTGSSDFAIGGTAVSDDLAFVAVTVAEVVSTATSAPFARRDRRLAQLL